MLALKPNQELTHLGGGPRTPAKAAREQQWGGPEQSGQCARVVRTYRDGPSETWWATDCQAGPYQISGPLRLVVAITDPVTLLAHSTRYLAADLALPDPPSPAGGEAGPARPVATLAEVVSYYGLRPWCERGYKQVKHELGWADFQVRSSRAIRRHWVLVDCAFSFCWHHEQDTGSPTEQDTPPAPPEPPAPPAAALQQRPVLSWPPALRGVRSWLVPLHAIQCIMRAFADFVSLPELHTLLTMLTAGQGLCLYLPP
ncbi:hypothetical protein [Frankia sp. Cppng1_Ct_nod]|uniref:hypothetical protein n=1 Tax=Frankia sp. Cppng1_Ct_nod TaxID=2897162 RepID=UPI001A94FCB4|nr:hypothetical protein [Frankia sp. Cppng1_Ct_nod]